MLGKDTETEAQLLARFQAEHEAQRAALMAKPQYDYSTVTRGAEIDALDVIHGKIEELGIPQEKAAITWYAIYGQVNYVPRGCEGIVWVVDSVGVTPKSDVKMFYFGVDREWAAANGVTAETLKEWCTPILAKWVNFRHVRWQGDLCKEVTTKPSVVSDEHLQCRLLFLGHSIRLKQLDQKGSLLAANPGDFTACK